MTDEEKANKYADRHSFRVPYDGSNKFYDDTDFKASKDGFLEGLKAGRPQWHDLRKDPNDLPKENCQVITVGKSPRRLLIKKVAYYLRSEKKFTLWNKEYENFTKLHNVIAWCEIPPFDKE